MSIATQLVLVGTLGSMAASLLLVALRMGQCARALESMCSALRARNRN